MKQLRHQGVTITTDKTTVKDMEKDKGKTTRVSIKLTKPDKHHLSHVIHVENWDTGEKIVLRSNTTTETERDKYQVKYFDKEFNPEKGFTTQVKGNLKWNLHFWKSVNANSFILKTIEEGYLIPFFELPSKARPFKVGTSVCACADILLKKFEHQWRQ